MGTTKKTIFELGPKYLALCAGVEKLDPVAAKYMREEAPKLRTFCQLEESECCALPGVFTWAETPQGQGFWSGLYREALHTADACAVPSPSPIPKAAKKPKPLAKWEKIPLNTKITKSGLVDIANELGRENAKLKNQITKLKESK